MLYINQLFLYINQLYGFHLNFAIQDLKAAHKERHERDFMKKVITLFCTCIQGYKSKKTVEKRKGLRNRLFLKET